MPCGLFNDMISLFFKKNSEVFEDVIKQMLKSEGLVTLDFFFIAPYFTRVIMTSFR